MRRIVKTIIYRILTIIVNFILLLLFGISMEIATLIGVGIEVVHTILYYFFEYFCDRYEKSHP